MAEQISFDQQNENQQVPHLTKEDHCVIHDEKTVKSKVP